jgi:hypothetical protein
VKETYYGLNIDDICEVIFDNIESIQDGTSGHTIAIKALNCKMDAAQRLSDKLTIFFYDHMYECDKRGQKV